MRFAGVLAIAAVSLTAQTSDNEDRAVSWKKLLPNIASDQPYIWTFPARLAHGHDVVPAAIFAGTVAVAVTSADGPAAHYFRNTSSFHGFNAVLASRATSLATLAAPVSLYLAGRIRRDSKMSNTALLAGQAIVDAELLTAVLKPVADRARPSTFPAHSRFSDTWAEGGNRFAGRDNSFPSGHTIAAFSAAAVIAQRYRNHRWVPILAYGGAAAIGFSRLTLSAHYPSDVLVGGALGYSIGRFAVLR